VLYVDEFGNKCRVAIVIVACAAWPTMTCYCNNVYKRQGGAEIRQHLSANSVLEGGELYIMQHLYDHHEGSIRELAT
jgi:hypothetical protein